MKRFDFSDWDGGRLRVNLAFAELLAARGLTSFRAFRELPISEVTKNLRSDRVTSRIVLDDGGRERAFYIKRHGPAPWREYAKALVRLRWPIVGAENEWSAILRFHHVGIPTMTPVVLGRDGRHSFLMTEAIEGCVKLSDWLETHLAEVGDADRSPPETRELIAAVARVARTMHRAGMHHQDFYAGHLLTPADRPEVHVIDLGRVRTQCRLSRHWIVKDLAQLHYSTRSLSRGDRIRFLRAYLGRPLRNADRQLIRQVESKAAAIARHSKKNSL